MIHSLLLLCSSFILLHTDKCWILFVRNSRSSWWHKPSFLLLQDGTRKTVNDLLSKYPHLTSRVFLGSYRTAELGQRIGALVITNKQSNPNNDGDTTISSDKGKMLVVSSIHARELATAETSECLLFCDQCYWWTNACGQQMILSLFADLLYMTLISHPSSVYSIGI